MTVVVMIDSIHANIGHVPQGVKCAGYVTGSSDIVWSSGDWARHPGAVRIDQSPRLSHYAAGTADVADVEQYAGTVTTFTVATHARVGRGQRSCIYGTSATLTTAAGDLRTAGVNLANVDCWLANWDLNATAAGKLVGTRVAGMRCVAVQWASPTSNPRTIVPGGSAPLERAQVDISVADSGWLAQPTGTVATGPRQKRQSGTISQSCI